MLRFHPRRFGWVLALTLGLGAVAAQAQEFRYHYVSLRRSQVELPPGFIGFSPIAINNSGRIYGTAYESISNLPHVAIYKNGAVTVLQPGIVSTANAGGAIEGRVLLDAENFIEQAALFHSNQEEIGHEL